MMSLLVSILFLLLSCTAFASPQGRFFLEGDGTLYLVNSKTGAGGSITYRSADGSYLQEGHQEINRIFGVPAGSLEGISLRLITLFDYLQDHFQAGPIRIVSGYRSPDYNEGLRKKGRLAARTSLHIEGMAADIEMERVEAKKLWEYVRSLDCCGAGYYHGKATHLDTGPSRFWDETSTKVEQDLGAQNKLILLRTEYDLYRPGEEVRLILTRITDYPFGIQPEAELLGAGKKIRLASGDSCKPIQNRTQGRSLTWTIPNGFSKPEKFKIQIEFCDKPFPEMPDRIESNPFIIQSK